MPSGPLGNRTSPQCGQPAAMRLQASGTCHGRRTTGHALGLHVMKAQPFTKLRTPVRQKVDHVLVQAVSGDSSSGGDAAKALQANGAPTKISLPFLKLEVTPTVYLAAEIAVLVFDLMLIDAAFSGDWSRIGVISKGTELVLQKFAILVTLAHTATAVLAAQLASKRGLNPWITGLKGFLFGSLHVNRVSQIDEVQPSPPKQ